MKTLGDFSADTCDDLANSLRARLFDKEFFSESFFFVSKPFSGHSGTFILESPMRSSSCLSERVAVVILRIAFPPQVRSKALSLTVGTPSESLTVETLSESESDESDVWKRIKTVQLILIFPE